MEKIIVTGATGFVGKALVARIAQQFPSSKILPLGSNDADLSSQAEAFDLFERIANNFNCEHIIHLAAMYKAGDWPVLYPATQFYINMQINTNLLECWKRFMPNAKLTSVLPYCIYPSRNEPHLETEVYGIEPDDYIFAYAFTKKALLIAQRAYLKEFGMRSTSVVLPTIYGPGDSFEQDSHVIGALIGKFVGAAKAGALTVEVWGDGKQEREFIYVDDAADGIIAAAIGSEADLLNIGIGRAEAIEDIALKIRNASRYTGDIVYNNDRFVGVSRRVLDVSRMRIQLDWVARTSIDEGIIRTVRWYERELGQRPTPRLAKARLATPRTGKPALAKRP